MLVRLIVGALATWRLSLMLVEEAGPFDIFERVRRKAEVYYLGEDGRPTTFFGKLLSCLWCTSVWMGTGVTIVALSPVWYVLIPFAFSGFAVIVHLRTGPWDDQT